MRNPLLICVLLLVNFTGCQSPSPFAADTPLGIASSAIQRTTASGKQQRQSGLTPSNGLVIESNDGDFRELNVGKNNPSQSAAQVSRIPDSVSDADVSPVSFVEELPFEPLSGAQSESQDSVVGVATESVQLPDTQIDSVYYDNGSYVDNSASPNSFPIDLPTVLQLAGADNWNVKIARERVCEAKANYSAAAAAWLPSLTFGMGYNHHEGEIQSTEGVVSEVSRGSLFVGGGATIGDMPLTGGSGGPLRLTADLSIADAIYRPLAARQVVSAERNAKSRVFDDVMLESALAYLDLAQAQQQFAIALRNQQDAEELNQVVRAFVDAGKGTDADSSRIRVVVNQSKIRVAEQRSSIHVSSAELARVLQLDATKLDPGLGLFASDSIVIPVHLVDRSLPVGALVSSALMTRSDICEAEARAEAARTRADLERVRPYFPNLHVGYSGGVYGGGQGSTLNKLDGRGDVDVQLTWEIRNLGLGVRAAKNVTRSQLNQSIYAGRAIKDQIETEVSQAYHQVNLFAEAMTLSESSITEATNALEKNMQAIQGLEGLPVEAIQSILFLAQARTEYLASVMNYNRWQFRLIRAIGQPISNGLTDSQCGPGCSSANSR